jgi:hypothetical protein
VNDDEAAEHATSSIPIVTATDGNAYIGVDAAVALLRAIAASCRNLADDPDCDLHGAAAAIDIEADNLDCLGIQHTK